MATNNILRVEPWTSQQLQVLYLISRPLGEFSGHDWDCYDPNRDLRYQVISNGVRGCSRAECVDGSMQRPNRDCQVPSPSTPQSSISMWPFVHGFPTESGALQVRHEGACKRISVASSHCLVLSLRTNFDSGQIGDATQDDRRCGTHVARH